MRVKPLFVAAAIAAADAAAVSGRHRNGVSLRHTISLQDCGEPCKGVGCPAGWVPTPNTDLCECSCEWGGDGGEAKPAEEGAAVAAVVSETHEASSDMHDHPASEQAPPKPAHCAQACEHVGCPEGWVATPYATQLDGLRDGGFKCDCGCELAPTMPPPDPYAASPPPPCSPPPLQPPPSASPSSPPNEPPPLPPPPSPHFPPPPIHAGFRIVNEKDALPPPAPLLSPPLPPPVPPVSPSLASSPAGGSGAGTDMSAVEQGGSNPAVAAGAAEGAGAGAVAGAGARSSPSSVEGASTEKWWTAPTDRSRCPLLNGKGYLIYLAFNNQFNNQLETLAENVMLANATGRVLVLTGFLEASSQKSHNSDGGDYHGGAKAWYPASSALDLHKSLDGQCDWIDIDDFRKLCPGPVDTEVHTFMHTWDPPFDGSHAERDVMGWQLPESTFPWEGIGAPNPRNGPIPELSDIKFNHVHMYAYKQAKLQINYLPKAEDLPVMVTDNLFLRGECCVEPTLREASGFESSFPIIGHFAWNDEIERRAADYIDWAFGERFFVAVHWRRGFTAEMAQRDRDEIVKLVHEAAAAAGHATAEVYVASNKLEDAERHDLQRALHSGGVHSIVLDWGGNGDFAITSRVEQAICVRAGKFIDHPGSTWSNTVLAMRAWQYAHGEGPAERTESTL